MALRVGSRLEVGQRVAWLRKQTGMNQRDAAEALGIDDPGLFSRIELHGKSFDYERLAEIAAAFAGKGQLIDDARAVFDFIVFHGEVARVLHPTLRLVGEDEALGSMHRVDKEEAPTAAGASLTTDGSGSGSSDQKMYSGLRALRPIGLFCGATTTPARWKGRSRTNPAKSRNLNHRGITPLCALEGTSHPS